MTVPSAYNIFTAVIVVAPSLSPFTYFLSLMSWWLCNNIHHGRTSSTGLMPTASTITLFFFVQGPQYAIELLGDGHGRSCS